MKKNGKNHRSERAHQTDNGGCFERYMSSHHFQCAVTHSSVVQDSDDSYERHEFLGDRVVGLLVAERLFRIFPHADEGGLALRYNGLVNRTALATLARDLGLVDYIRMSDDLRNQDNERIHADCFEAVVAAIYLDHGLDEVRRFLIPLLSLAESPKAEFRDPKSELQERLAANGCRPPAYRVVERSGPDHAPCFRVACVLPKETGARIKGITECAPFEGEGTSLQRAEQVAARVCLIAWPTQT